ncbi:MAG: magnesium transporter [Verrucomicrobiae bacterium]|nr:magnesium transporter [Verrucomicrobiae bacterium]
MVTENDDKTLYTQLRPLPQYAGMHPADLADHLQRLPIGEARDLLHQLPESQAAEVLSELVEARAGEILKGLSNGRIATLLSLIPSNRAADLMNGLSLARRREILSAMTPEVASQITALLHYAPETAGGIMSNRFIALRSEQTIEECQQLLRSRETEETEDVSYLYVTDASRRLIGVVSLRDLVFRRPERRIEDIMDRDVKSLRVDDDREKIAQVFEHYHYLGLPVLEEDGTLVGVVSASNVIDIVQAEATEDMQRMVGVSGEERALTPWHKSIGPRFLWLGINLLTAFLAASVVNLFESTIAKWTVLAVFLPIIAGQGGNAGTQTLTVIIRGMATGEISVGDGKSALIKEIILGLINGVSIGLIVGLGCLLWKGSMVLGIVVAVAMVLNMVAAALAGVMIPYGLKALRIDPALASGIFVTTVTDVAGFFFFLGLAAVAIRWFGIA